MMTLNPWLILLSIRVQKECLSTVFTKLGNGQGTHGAQSKKRDTIIKQKFRISTLVQKRTWKSNANPEQIQRSYPDHRVTLSPNPLNS